jgi:hypothetical protein
MTSGKSFVIMHPTTDAIPATNGTETLSSRLLNADQPGLASREDSENSTPVISTLPSPIATSSEVSGTHQELHGLDLTPSPVTSANGEQGPIESPYKALESASQHVASPTTTSFPHKWHGKTVSAIFGFILAGKPVLNIRLSSMTEYHKHF